MVLPVERGKAREPAVSGVVGIVKPEANLEGIDWIEPDVGIEAEDLIEQDGLDGDSTCASLPAFVFDLNVRLIPRQAEALVEFTCEIGVNCTV